VTLIDKGWNADISTILAVNDRSGAAGSIVLTGASNSRAFFWNVQTFTIIEPPAGFTGTGSADMNNVGQVLARSAPGNVPTLWQHGTAHLLSDLVIEPVDFGTPQAINDQGQILIRVGNTKGGLLSPLEVPTGDLNLDCRVDYRDLLIVFEQWGPVPRERNASGAPSADLNGDGVVNVTDLLILFDHWTN
jgi:hypothetical protein